MLEKELNVILNAINSLQQSTSIAEKYGPYFFALALLIVAPFLCRAVFAKEIDRARDADVRRKAYADFRLYFRSTLAAGLFFSLAAVGWWLYENLREEARTSQALAELKIQLAAINQTMEKMHFAASGVISEGLSPEDVFITTFTTTSDISIVFAKLPTAMFQSEASWYFVVMSNKELPPSLDTTVGYSLQGAEKPMIVNMPIHLTFGEKSDFYYKFSFSGNVADVRPSTRQ